MAFEELSEGYGATRYLQSFKLSPKVHLLTIKGKGTLVTEKSS